MHPRLGMSVEQGGRPMIVVYTPRECSLIPGAGLALRQARLRVCFISEMPFSITHISSFTQLQTKTVKSESTPRSAGLHSTTFQVGV